METEKAQAYSTRKIKRTDAQKTKVEVYQKERRG